MVEQKSPVKWKFETGGSVQSSPLVFEGLVYFGSDDKHLYALDIKTGEEKWKFETAGSLNIGDPIHSDPMVYNNIIYIKSNDNQLYFLDIKTGKEQWKFESGGGVSSSPIVSEGMVYFGSKDHNIYAVDIKALKEKLNQFSSTVNELNKKEIFDELEKKHGKLIKKRDLMMCIWGKVCDDLSKQSYEVDINGKKIRVNSGEYIMEDQGFAKEFFYYINIDDLGTGVLSKNEIENWLDEGISHLCRSYESLSIRLGEEINEPHYLSVEVINYNLEDLNPKWTEKNYLFDDEKQEDIIKEVFNDVGYQ